MFVEMSEEEYRQYQLYLDKLRKAVKELEEADNNWYVGIVQVTELGKETKIAYHGFTRDIITGVLDAISKIAPIRFIEKEISEEEFDSLEKEVMKIL